MKGTDREYLIKEAKMISESSLSYASILLSLENVWNMAQKAQAQENALPMSKRA